MPVLEKIDLVDYWDMIAQDVLAPEAEVVGGPHAGELAKIPDQVGLVKVSTVQRHIWPIWFCGPPRERPDLLKSQHAAEQLRRETDLRCKDLDKPALA